MGAFQASPAWTGPRPSGPTGVLLKNVPDTELVYFIAYEGPGGKASVNFNPILGNTSIGANASDAVTEKLLAMLDEIHTNMELYGRVAYGEEGVNYEWDEDGLLIQKPGFGTGEERTNRGWQYFTMWNTITPDIIALPAAALAHHSAHHRHRRAEARQRVRATVGRGAARRFVNQLRRQGELRRPLVPAHLRRLREWTRARLARRPAGDRHLRPWRDGRRSRPRVQAHLSRVGAARDRSSCAGRGGSRTVRATRWPRTSTSCRPCWRRSAGAAY